MAQQRQLQPLYLDDLEEGEIFSDTETDAQSAESHSPHGPEMTHEKIAIVHADKSFKDIVACVAEPYYNLNRDQLKLFRRHFTERTALRTPTVDWTQRVLRLRFHLHNNQRICQPCFEALNANPNFNHQGLHAQMHTFKDSDKCRRTLDIMDRTAKLWCQRCRRLGRGHVTLFTIQIVRERRDAHEYKDWGKRNAFTKLLVY